MIFDNANNVFICRFWIIIRFNVARLPLYVCKYEFTHFLIIISITMQYIFLLTCVTGLPESWHRVGSIWSFIYTTNNRNILLLNMLETKRGHIRIGFTQIYLLMFLEMWNQTAVYLSYRRIICADRSNIHLGCHVGFR
jgi:hypothetical protein